MVFINAVKLIKGESEFDQFEYIWESCLHVLRNLNEILHIDIICVSVSKIKSLNSWIHESGKCEKY